MADKDTAWPRWGGIAIVTLFAAVKLILHLFVNTGYGFHRDELQTLDDARNLAWGYVAYPPLAPFLGRIELALFGTSLTGFRFFAAAAQSVVMIVAALLARRMGGGKAAQIITAAAVAISPVSLGASSLFQYVSFDLLWWVVIAWMVASLVDSGDPRWWLGIGTAIGLGVQTKYTIVFLVAGVVVGVLATNLRRHLRSGWLWGGVALSLAIAAPNLIWQAQNDFISLDFLRHIHERDVRIGRTSGFLGEQLYVASNFVTVPLWLTGLASLFTSERLRRFRILGIMTVVPFLLFLLAEGRGYYTAPLFVTMIAAGAVIITTAIESLRPSRRRLSFAAIALLLVVGTPVAVIAMPLAPVGSELWRTALEMNGDLREEFGWVELTEEVARIWHSIPAEQRNQTAIFGGNYGQAGAINLYGPRFGLPRAVSGVNSFWYRGYGSASTRQIIVLGASREDLGRWCSSVDLAGQVANRFGVRNEESTEHREIFLCRGLKIPISELWPLLRSFG